MEKIKIITILCFSWLLLFTELSAVRKTANIADAPTLKPIKIAIIGDTEKHLTYLDMLTVKLSVDDNIHVLERSDWDYLLRERQISQSKIGQSSVKIGRLLGADALIILTEEEIKGKKYLLSKLVAVKSGIILDSIASPVGEKKEAFSLADSIEFRFKPKLGKLKSNGDKIVISLLNLRSAIASPELLTIEKELNTIFAQRLMREQNVLVSERWNIAEAAFEKNLDGKDSSEFKTGSVILDGTIELKAKETVEVNLFITTPDGKKQKFKVSDKKDNLGKLAEELNTRCLAIAKIAKNSLEWNREKEADEYYKEAMWAFNAGLFFKAAQSAESAWALGCRKKKLTKLRIESYSNAAYPAMFNLNNRQYNSYKNLVDVSKTDKHLNAAIMALEIFKHYIKRKKENKKLKYNQQDCFLGNNTVNNVSLLLKAYYDQKLISKDQEKQQFTRKLLVECNDNIGKIERSLRTHPTSIWSFFEHAKLWFDTPEETMKNYERALAQEEWEKSTYCRKNMMRYNSFTQYDPPFFMDWSGKYDKNIENELRKTFCKRLMNSKNKQLQLDSLAINYLFGYPNPSYFTNQQPDDSVIYDFNRNKSNLSKIYKFYQQHKKLFWNNTIKIDPFILKELMTQHDDLLYKYLEGVLKNRNLHQVKYHSSDLPTRRLSKLSNTQKKTLYSLLDNLIDAQKQKQMYYPKIDSIKSGFELDEMVAFFPDKIYKKPDKLKKFDKQQSCIYNNNIYCLYKTFTYEKNNVQYALHIIDLSTSNQKVIIYPKVDLAPSIPFNMSNLIINKNQAIFLGFGSLLKLNINRNELISFDVPTLYGYPVRILSKNNKVYALFSTNRNKSPSGSGMLEIDIKTGAFKLLFGTRKKPGRTILDDCTPYHSYVCSSGPHLTNTFALVNGNYILMQLRFENHEYFRNPYFIYDISTGLVHNLIDMPHDFFNKYLNSFTTGKRWTLSSYISDSGKIIVLEHYFRKINKTLEDSGVKRIDLKFGKYYQKELFLLSNAPKQLIFRKEDRGNNNIICALDKNKDVLKILKVKLYDHKSKILEFPHFIMDKRGLYITSSSNKGYVNDTIYFYSRKSIDKAFRKQKQEEK